MTSLVERRPVALTLGFGAAMIALTVVARVALEALFPSLILHGIGLILNWIFVALVVGLVAWLGWWERIRFMAPVDRRALIYLLPFAAMVFIPVAFGFAIPEVSLIEGTVLPAWAALFVIVVGVALCRGTVSGDPFQSHPASAVGVTVPCSVPTIPFSANGPQ